MSYSKANQKTENFQVTPGKLCRGGPYTWQGNSKRAQMCRAMYQNKEGKAEIQRYQCPNGFKGMPLNHWEYTPISNVQWANARCDNSTDAQLCDSSRNGIF